MACGRACAPCPSERWALRSEALRPLDTSQDCLLIRGQLVPSRGWLVARRARARARVAACHARSSRTSHQVLASSDGAGSASQGLDKWTSSASQRLRACMMAGLKMRIPRSGPRRRPAWLSHVTPSNYTQSQTLYTECTLYHVYALEQGGRPQHNVRTIS